MIVKIFIVLMILAMIASLASALWFMMKDRGQGTRTVKALTLRIGIWVVLFGLLGVGLATGWIQPSNSLQSRVPIPAQAE